MPFAINPDELSANQLGPGLELAQALGAELELRLVLSKNILLLTPDEFASLTSTLDLHGVSVASIASPLFKWAHRAPTSTHGVLDRFAFPTVVSPDDELAWARRAVDIAERLGAPVVRVFGGLRGAPRERPLVDALKDALRYAEQHHTTLAIENEPVCEVATAAELHGVLEALEDYGLRVWLDPANLQQVGDARPAVVSHLHRHVACVHLKDYAGFSGEHRSYCPLGEGEVPWADLAPLLRPLSAEVVYAAETHVRSETSDAIRIAHAFYDAHLSYDRQLS